MATISKYSISGDTTSPKVVLTVNETSYSVENNTSTLSYKMTLERPYQIIASSSPAYSISINGSTVKSGNTSIGGSGTKTIATGTTTITHNADGTKRNMAIAFSLALNITWSGKSTGTVSASGTMNLTDIPRKSSVTCNSFNIGDSTTITIARASDSFTHTLTYTYGTKTGTIATKTTATSVGWTAPVADFYSQIPNGTTGYGSITCETFNGTTSLGTTTASFNAYAKESEAKPTLSTAIVDTNTTTTALTGDSSKLIRYMSKPRVTITATPKYSAVIRSYLTLNGDGSSSSTATTTFSNGVASPIFSTAITDSRGYNVSTTTDLSSNSKWVNYIKLAFTSIEVKRAESTGDSVTITVKGNYFNKTFGATGNTITLKYMYKQAGGSYGSYQTITPTITGDTFTATTTITGIDYKKEYRFILSVEDKLMAVISEEQPLPKGKAIFRIGDDYVRVNGQMLDENGNDVSIVEFKHSDSNGYIHYSNGLLKQWGKVAITPTAANAVTSAVITFPKAYDEVPRIGAEPQINVPTAVTVGIGGGTTVAASKVSMVIYMTRINTIATSFQWEAIGYKNP